MVVPGPSFRLLLPLFCWFLLSFKHSMRSSHIIVRSNWPRRRNLRNTWTYGKRWCVSEVIDDSIAAVSLLGNNADTFFPLGFVAHLSALHRLSNFMSWKVIVLTAQIYSLGMGVWPMSTTNSYVDKVPFLFGRIEKVHLNYYLCEFYRETYMINDLIHRLWNKIMFSYILLQCYIQLYINLLSNSDIL